MMTPENEKIVSTLNNLIVTCKDGQEGFRNAAEGVTSIELKTLFNNCAQKRAELLSEIHSEVRRLGGDPDQSGTISEALLRGWLNMKQVMTGKNETAVVDEAERGEDVAVKNYQQALKENLPPDVRVIVVRQYTQIKEAHDRISALKKTHHAQA